MSEADRRSDRRVQAGARDRRRQSLRSDFSWYARAQLAAIRTRKYFQRLQRSHHAYIPYLALGDLYTRERLCADRARTQAFALAPTKPLIMAAA